MYKLTVVVGPNRGTSFAIHENTETSIGRHGDNAVVLSSARISKKHCTLKIENGNFILTDLGSSNGTFVNGVLVKTKNLTLGDRVSVGEYVLELSKPGAKPKKAPAVAGFGNVIDLSSSQRQGASGVPGFSGASGIPGMAGVGGAAVSLPDAMNLDQPPQDLLGKLGWIFDKQVMPFFYGLNLKQQWRILLLLFFGVFVSGAVLISVYPVLESSRTSINKAVGLRASFMAKQIAEYNAQFLAAGAESKTEIGLAETAPGVKLALLVDMDSRVLAPASRMNQYLTSGSAAVAVVKTRDLFRQGRETGLWLLTDSTTVTAIEPVKVLNQRVGKNVIAGMAVVALDTSAVTLKVGEIGVIYSEALIVAAMLGGLIFMILYKLTLKPYLVLSDDLDRALKGDIGQVTHEYKVEEVNSLWESINSALQRIPKAGSANRASDEIISADLLSGLVRMIGEIGKFGIVLCDSDRHIAYMNSMFEEITGIRLDSAIGQSISDVARDQGFASFVTDLFDRIGSAGQEFISEDFDFSGVSFRVYTSAFTMPGGQVKGVVMAFVKAEG